MAWESSEALTCLGGEGQEWDPWDRLGVGHALLDLPLGDYLLPWPGEQDKRGWGGGAALSPEKPSTPQEHSRS